MRTCGLGIVTIVRLMLNGRAGGRNAEAVEGSNAWVRGWCRSWRGAGATLVVLCACVFLPGLVSIPPVDRDESRFAQASRQMYESRDFVVPRIQDRPRLNKPPLIYWLQCGSIAVFGDREGQYPNANIWVFRVPSVLCATLTVLLTWRLGLRMFDARAAVLGAALLAVCPMVVWDAHQARADQLLLATTIASMLTLWRVWSASERARTLGWAAAFWIALGAGVLAKGPITPMVAGLTVLALSVTTRRWAWIWRLRPASGLAVVTMMVGPWVYAVGERVGWNAYLTEIYEETLGRSKSPKEGHWGPPGYHLVLLCALFWPGVLTTADAFKSAFAAAFAPAHHPRAGALSRALARLRSPRPHRRAELFLLCWVLPAWIVFELIATKLPHYTLPMYPAIALLSARALFAAPRRPRASAPAPRHTPGLPLGHLIWALTGLVVVIALAAISLLFPPSGSRPGVWVEGAINGAAWCIGAFALYSAFRAIRHDDPGRAVCRAMLASAFLSAAALTGALPTLIPGAQTVRIAAAIAKADPDAQRPLCSRYHEDSLIFTTRARARWVDDHLPFLAQNPGAIAIVPSSEPRVPASHDLVPITRSPWALLVPVAPPAPGHSWGAP